MARYQVIQAVVREVEADSAEEAAQYFRISLDYLFRYARADVELLDRPKVSPVTESPAPAIQGG